MGFIKEFKEFAMKGKIVSSLVDDVLMPLIGMACNNIDFTSLALKIGEGENAAVLKYGVFIQNVIDFLIIAFCIFLMIKAMNKLMPKKEEPEAPAGPTQEELLTEIRDLLKKK